MISVITPSCREKGLDIVKQSLDNQTFDKAKFEWIVCSPFEYKNSDIWLSEPNKKKGDMYNLNKCWNKMFKRANGELIVSFVDMTWAPPDALENFWLHYENNPKAVIGGIGHQYEKVIEGKPEILIWRDPRAQTQYGSFWEINPIDMEFCLTSVPKQAIFDIGGWDEKWDQFAALSEKEACLRMDKLGYRFFLDNSIEYRALTHPRLTKDWDQKYQLGIEYFNWCKKEIDAGDRLKLNFL